MKKQTENAIPLTKEQREAIRARGRDDGYVDAHNDLKKFYKDNRYLVVIEFNEDGGFVFKVPNIHYPCAPLGGIYHFPVGLETVESPRAQEANEKVVAHLYDVFVEEQSERLVQEQEAMRSEYV